MDITSIDDINTLKSMAYDQMVIAEQAGYNLRLIQEQISKKEKQDEEKSQEQQS